jgi:hypothetical protein
LMFAMSEIKLFFGNIDGVKDAFKKAS